jgi:glycerol-3-phosphate acyltransferase PlsY
VIGASVAAALIVQRHRANLARLQQGSERRLGR